MTSVECQTLNGTTIPVHSLGKVVKAYGNLLHVEYEGDIKQGEVALVQVDNLELKAEVIEIVGNQAKIQVFEDTRGVKLNTLVKFTGRLLEAELGPGLLTSIFDGLQNPLEKVAEVSGLYLPRGVYLDPLDRIKTWDYTPKAIVGDTLSRGEILGTTQEGKFEHPIMVPFNLYGTYTITWTIEPGTYTVDTVIATAKDEHGTEHSLTMIQRWPIKSGLSLGEKIKPSELMETGCRIIDIQFPIMKGGTFCTPGPFGAGKTVLQHHLSKFSAVDIVIVCACGERAGEVVEVLKEFPHLIDPHTGKTLMERTVIICNTSSMPVAARESSIYLGMTVAEYYRQIGLDVLLLADSTSRWAQALREMSGRLEEIPGEEAFPAYLASRIADFYERSGVLSLANEKTGSVTVCGAVSPAGGNFEEPVTQSTLAVVGAFLGLSRQRSDSRKYPAVDPLISWSKYSSLAGKEMDKKLEGWSQTVLKAEEILKKSDEIEKRMEVVGEEGTSIHDLIILFIGRLYDRCILQQNAFDKEDEYCPIDRQIILLSLIQKIFQKNYTFHSHDKARKYFLDLENIIKNSNYLPLDSEEFKVLYQEIINKINDSSEEQ